MQDIDFDEIDRAVNSVSSGDAPVPVPVVAEPVSVSKVEASNEPEAEVPVSATPAARRSSGRFMDVVHPSSDMRPTTSTADPRPAPSAPSLHREEVAERPEVVTVRPEPATSQSSAFHWPDPISLTPAEPINPVVPVPSTETAAGTPQLDDAEEELSASLESPFLMDAKVEKRPLGAFSGADADLPLLEDPIPFSTNPTAEPEIVPEAEVLSHEEHEEVPNELHDKLLALDGHGQDHYPDEPLLEAVNPPDPAPVVTEAPTGPTSINQQYKEQPTSSVETSGSIFDTEAYHKALAHPAKKRSSALIIVWIIALILVGGGIGAGVYFILLPMLG